MISNDESDESFSLLPSTILEIAHWDRDMVVMWAEALSLSDKSVERLRDAAASSDTPICGKHLLDAESARQALEPLLADEVDLKVALEELEAMRFLQGLHPGSSGGGYITNLTSSGSDGTDAMMMALVEPQLQRLHAELQASHPSKALPSTTTTASGKIAPPPITEQEEAVVYWGDDWAFAQAPPIAFVSASSVKNCHELQGVDSDDESQQEAAGEEDKEESAQAAAVVQLSHRNLEGPSDPGNGDGGDDVRRRSSHVRSGSSSSSSSFSSLEREYLVRYGIIRGDEQCGGGDYGDAFDF